MHASKARSLAAISRATGEFRLAPASVFFGLMAQPPSSTAVRQIVMTRIDYSLRSGWLIALAVRPMQRGRTCGTASVIGLDVMRGSLSRGGCAGLQTQ